MAMNVDRLLFYLENGMLDLREIEQNIAMKERELYLQRHRFKVYQGKDGNWYTYILEENGRKKVKRKDKSNLEEVIVSHYRELEPSNITTIKDIFDEWNERKLRLGKIKPATFTRNEQIFNRHFHDICGMDVTKLTPDAITDFLEEQAADHDLGSRAFSNLKSLTRGIFKRAKKRGLISFSIDQALEDVDVSDLKFKTRIIEDGDEIFYDDEMEEMLSVCKSRMDLPSLGVALMFVTGLRVGEVVVLKGSDISNGIVKVTKTETRYREDGRVIFEVSSYPKTPAGVRNVVVPDKYSWILDGLRCDPYDFIFIGRNGNRLHTQAIRKRMYQICNELGINRRSPHKARKTYASILLDSNVDKKFIEKQMGHTDISCTENYYHRDRRGIEEKRKVLNSVPQFEYHDI